MDQKLALGPLVAALIALAGCASPSGEGSAVSGFAGLQSTANRVKLSDGSEAWLISCQGWANNISTCVSRAKLACPSGYRFAPPNSGLAVGDRALLIQCEAAAK